MKQKQKGKHSTLQCADMALSTHLQYCTRSSSTDAPNFTETAEACRSEQSQPQVTPLLMWFGHKLRLALAYLTLDCSVLNHPHRHRLNMRPVLL